MRINQMPAEQSFDVMLAMLPYVSNIIGDDAVSAAKNAATDTTNAGDYLKMVFPLLFGSHREDLYGIAAAVNGATVDEMKRAPALELRDTLVGAIGDIMSFFPLCVSLVGKR